MGKATKKDPQEHLRTSRRVRREDTLGEDIITGDSLATEEATHDLSTTPLSSSHTTNSTVPNTWPSSTETFTTGQNVSWWERVNGTVSNIEVLVEEISLGATDTEHANRLEEESDALDALVAQGSQDPQLVLEASYHEILDLMSTVEQVSQEAMNVSQKVQEDICEAEVIIKCITHMYSLAKKLIKSPSHP